MANELTTLPYGNGNPEMPAWNVGQKVIVRGCSTESIATITRITDGRKGTVYIKDTAYDSCGHERGGDNSRYASFNKTWIHVPTLEEMAKSASRTSGVRSNTRTGRPSPTKRFSKSGK